MRSKKRRKSKKMNKKISNMSKNAACSPNQTEIMKKGEYRDEATGSKQWSNLQDDLHQKDMDIEDLYPDYMSKLSLEVLCNIMKYLHLRDFLKLDHLSSKLHIAVSMHLRVKKRLDFTEGELMSWMSDRMCDSCLSHLFKRCPDLEYIYGFHPPYLSKRRQRGARKLSVPGIIDALSLLKQLRGIEVSDTLVLETLFNYFPLVEILGTFRNRDGCFPVDTLNILRIPEDPLITSMHLIGIVIPKLPAMLHLRHLQLRYVHFINPQPFKDFAVPSLKSFVMANCAGPSNVLKYVPLIAGLAAARGLQRMELIRVPFLGGLLHHVVEESVRVHRFKNMQTMKFGACKHVIGMDVGFLAISSAENLEEMYLQPSLTKDSLFIALKMAFVSFPVFDRLSLGFIEPFQESGNWTNQDLVIEGLANISETPATISDIGMKAVGECFTSLKFLEIYNSPHIHRPTEWLTPAVNAWGHLRELVLRRCHSIKLADFCQFIPLLPVIEAVHLELMFREPPKGCSRVGLSAGTGFGMSSSLIPDAAVPQNNQVPNQNEVNNNGPANQNAANNVNEVLANQQEVIYDGNAASHENGGENGQVVRQEDVEEENINQFNQEHHRVSVESLNNSERAKPLENQPSTSSCICPSNTESSFANDKSKFDEKVQIHNQNCQGLCTTAGSSTSSTHCCSDLSKKSKHEVSNVSCDKQDNNITKSSTENLKCSNSNGNNVMHGKNLSQVSDTATEETFDKLWDDLILKEENDEINCNNNTNPSNTDSVLMENSSESMLVIEELKQEVELGSSSSDVLSAQQTIKSATTDNEIVKNSSESMLDVEELKQEVELGSSSSSSAQQTIKSSTTDNESANSSLSEQSSSCSVPSSEGGRRHGKSLYGKKKGLARKKSSHESLCGNSKTTENKDMNHIIVGTSCSINKHETLEENEGKDIKTENSLTDTDIDKTNDQEEVYSFPVTRSKARKNLDSKTNKEKSSNRKRKATSDSCEKAKLEKNVMVLEVKFMMDRWCQVNVNDIRQSTASTDVQNTCGTSGYVKIVNKQKKSPVMCNKCTSTSDPVMEDDHIQILKLKSHSLQCITMNMVGITNVVVEDCPKLSKISGHACRVLKDITVCKASSLNRINFTQCRKLDEFSLAEQIGKLPRLKNRVIFLRPMHEFDARSLERYLFSSKHVDYNICVIYDHSPEPLETLYNRVRVQSWQELISGMNVELLQNYGYEEWVHEESEEAQKYPWNRSIYTMSGYNNNGSRWEMITDIPWLRPLYESPDIDEGQKVKNIDNRRPGVYCPAIKGHETVQDCIVDCLPNIVDGLSVGLPLCLHSIIVYVNLCDINGTPTFDPYI